MNILTLSGQLSHLQIASDDSIADSQTFKMLLVLDVPSRNSRESYLVHIAAEATCQSQTMTLACLNALASLRAHWNQ